MDCFENTGHPNLITLMGFARGPQGERVLIYEYLCEGDFAQCMDKMIGNPLILIYYVF